MASSFISTAIATKLSRYVSRELQLPLGLAIASGVEWSIYNIPKYLGEKFNIKITPNYNEVIIENGSAIYRQIERYIISKHSEHITRCKVMPNLRELDIVLDNGKLSLVGRSPHPTEITAPATEAVT